MAKEFKFYLDGTEIEDPKGWDKSEKKIQRIEKYRGVFVEYINNLIFINDGYDYIKNLVDTNGFCGEVAVGIHILNDDNNYRVYFEGIIKLTDIFINESKCEIETSIEDANLTSILNNLGSVRVPFDKIKTISGLDISTSTIEYICNAHKATNTTTSIIHDQSRTMYKVFDSFQYVLSYISDNRITFASDLFSTEVSALVPPVYTSGILFTNPGVDLVGAGNVVIVYTNSFNEEFTLTIPKQGTVAATLNYIISQFNFNNDIASIQQKFYTQDWRYVPRATTNGTTTVSLQTNIKGFTINSVTGASASIANTAINLADEFGSLSICNGNELRGTALLKNNLTSPFADVTVTKVMEISFDDLWDNMNKIFNLGMTLGYVSGVLTLRIERFNYFFSQTQSISLTNIENLIVKSSDEYSFSSVTVGDGSENLGGRGTQNTGDRWLVSATCFEKELNIKNSWIVDSAQIDEQIRLRPNSVSTAIRNAITAPDLYEGLVIYNTDTLELNIAIDNVGGAGSWVVADSYYLNTLDKNDDKIFILECFDAVSDGTVRTSYFENRIYEDTAASYVQYWAYNANLMNYNKILSWMYLIIGDMRLNEYLLTNSSTRFLLNEYSFEHPLSHIDDRTILSDTSKFIRFNIESDSITGRAGWIKEISRDNKTGKTNFKLIGST